MIAAAAPCQGRDAWLKVKGNKGAPGVDGQSIGEFEKDLKGNLYKVWNRMSSGTCFPPPVLAVEVPKPHGGGPACSGCLASRTGSRRPWPPPGWRNRHKIEISTVWATKNVSGAC
jgi:hypothetical protein